MRPPLVVHIKSPKSVKRYLSEAPRLPVEPNRTALPKDKPNPLRVAEQWLGMRLELRDTGSHRLDGVPVSLHTIMRATNAILAAKGVEQIQYDPKWII
jgi:hypothetical protein